MRRVLFLLAHVQVAWYSPPENGVCFFIPLKILFTSLYPYFFTLHHIYIYIYIPVSLFFSAIMESHCLGQRDFLIYSQHVLVSFLAVSDVLCVTAVSPSAVDNTTTMLFQHHHHHHHPPPLLRRYLTLFCLRNILIHASIVVKTLNTITAICQQNFPSSLFPFIFSFPKIYYCSGFPLGGLYPFFYIYDESCQPGQ